jgi:uncharacterized membrane protein YidH (DUF202 family)
MADVFGQLVPLILGAILAPLWIIIVLLMIASPNGVLKATAFVAGMTFTRIMQGVIFGLVFGSSAATKAEDGGKSPVVSTLLLIVGILLLIAAYKKWQKEEDPDEPPPKWMQSIEGIAPLKALGMGALLVAIGPKYWVFTLSAIGVISQADLGQTASIALYAGYIVLAQILLILAVLISVIAPKASRTILKQAIDLLTTYNRPISVTVALIFGFYFAWDGITGLLAS